ncbi:hypothetical protein P3102_21055 [Amycolatopsis sp. QT-25]|uniref:hypothetical protein n=1 Tax=Amycolatopsis sp. QT-25 TaxID=3034022 RepID=UPI0023ECFF49|nr:hypothetical protein [Amycolatopsis sp. QT-25]WET76608.1 hypothetical protein P3102_21055 [Amycolatopsis sp. QT-25]
MISSPRERDNAIIRATPATRAGQHSLVGGKDAVEQTGLAVLLHQSFPAPARREFLRG